jgi:hypothetical protein
MEAIGEARAMALTAGYAPRWGNAPSIETHDTVEAEEEKSGLPGVPALSPPSERALTCRLLSPRVRREPENGRGLFPGGVYTQFYGFVVFRMGQPCALPTWAQ